MQAYIRVQQDIFDNTRFQAQMAADAQVGAVVDFTGFVRADDLSADDTVKAIFLEHYPSMTEKAMAAVVDQAALRWPIIACALVHRVGELKVGEPIVYVSVASSHRAAAFAAAQFIMDYLKSDVPIWKKEISASQARWVEQKSQDIAAKKQW